MEEFPRNLREFDEQFATEQACRDYLFRLHWPEGFRCPRCAGDQYWPVRSVLLECGKCGHQTSVTAGTILQDTRKPLTDWFRAMYWVTTQKNGASALGLQRVLELKSYKTAWTWWHKLRRAMVRPGRDRLTGRIEVDETFTAGVDEGRHGRHTRRKTLIVIAAQEDGPGIGRIRMRRIPDASAESLMPFIKEAIAPGSTVHTDGWLGYLPVDAAGYDHEITFLKGKKKTASELMPRVHRVASLTQALADGYPPRSGGSRTSRLLPGRVHFPLQPPPVGKPGQALLPLGTASRRHRPGTVQIPSQVRGGRRDCYAGKPQPVGVT